MHVCVGCVGPAPTIWSVRAQTPYRKSGEKHEGRKVASVCVPSHVRAHMRLRCQAGTKGRPVEVRGWVVASECACAALGSLGAGPGVGGKGERKHPVRDCVAPPCCSCFSRVSNEVVSEYACVCVRFAQSFANHLRECRPSFLWGGGDFRCLGARCCAPTAAVHPPLSVHFPVPMPSQGCGSGPSPLRSDCILRAAAILSVQRRVHLQV